MAKMQGLPPLCPSLPSAATSYTETKRLRGDNWMKLRARVLRSNCLCVHCSERGIIKSADEVDHIVPLAFGGTDAIDNLQGLCIDCHRRKSFAENKLLTQVG